LPILVSSGAFERRLGHGVRHLLPQNQASASARSSMYQARKESGECELRIDDQIRRPLGFGFNPFSAIMRLTTGLRGCRLSGFGPKLGRRQTLMTRMDSFPGCLYLRPALGQKMKQLAEFGVLSGSASVSQSEFLVHTKSIPEKWSRVTHVSFCVFRLPVVATGQFLCGDRLPTQGR